MKHVRCLFISGERENFSLGKHAQGREENSNVYCTKIFFQQVLTESIERISEEEVFADNFLFFNFLSNFKSTKFVQIF